MRELNQPYQAKIYVFMDKETININNENYMLMPDAIESLLSDKEQEVVDRLTESYINNSEIVMGEYLAFEKANGLTFEEAYHIYIALMKRAYGNQFYVIKEDEVTNIKPVTMSKHKLSKDEFIRKVNQTYGDDSKAIKDLQQLEQDVMADIITTIKK